MSAGRKTNTLSKNWNTPKKYVEVVKEFFEGSVDLDPCSNEFSIVHATKEFILPVNDGLKEKWNYKNIFVNPPYGRDSESKTSIKDWLEKCYMANNSYESEVLALIPVATNTSHWKEFIFKKASNICFLFDTRLKFMINGEECSKGAPMACAIIYWGNYSKKFEEVFSKFGAVIYLN